MRRIPLIVLLELCATVFLQAQDPPTEPPAQATLPAAGAVGRPGTPPSTDPQPYDRVITRDAKSKTGVFTVHVIKDRYYYEIPTSQLNKEFLWNTQIAKTTDGAGYGGQQLSDRVVRWELMGNKVHLRSIDYSVVADSQSPIAQAVR